MRSNSDELEIVNEIRMALPLLEGLGPGGNLLSAALAAYLAAPPGTTSIEGELGLAPSRGKERWQAVEARQRRDDAIRKLAVFFPSKPAKTIARELTRYSASAWRHDRALASPPAAYLGTAKEWLWRAHHEGSGKVPTTERQIRSVLGNRIP